MGVVQENIDPIKDYLIKINHDISDDSCNIEIGIPANWEYSVNNNRFDIKITTENEVGKFITLSSKDSTLTIDDLILFVRKIITTNKKMEEERKKLNERLERMKLELQEELIKQQEEINKIKTDLFTDENMNNLDDEIKPQEEIIQTPSTEKINSQNPISELKKIKKKEVQSDEKNV